VEDIELPKECGIAADRLIHRASVREYNKKMFMHFKCDFYFDFYTYVVRTAHNI